MILEHLLTYPLPALMASAANSVATLRRIVVGLKCHENSDAISLAKFIDCIVNYFAPNELSVKVSCKLQDNMLLLFPPTQLTEAVEGSKSFSTNIETTNNTHGFDLGSVILQHSPECPLWRLPESTDPQSISESALNQGVYVGVAVVVESSDSHILMTQRPNHMRAFPRAWVPPGGHLEFGENLFEGGSRELEEETGLKFDSITSHTRLLCLWESVYPVLLGIGPPKNHHVVVYLHTKSSESWEQLQSKMKLDPEEVQACTWLSRGDVKRLFGNDEERSWIIRKHVPGPNGLVSSELDLSQMFPSSLWQEKKIYSGTQLALLRWLDYRCQQDGENIPSKM